jgi:hypothetical protein
MNINKDLINGDKLTKRGMQNQRARLAKLGSLCGNIIEGVLSKSIHCKQCDEEFDPGNTISKVELDTIKLVYSKTLSDVSSQDVDEVSDEVKTPEQQAESLISILSDNTKLVDMVKADYKKAKAIGDALVEMTSNVEGISKQA